jgi:hypothetical protein
MPNTLLSLARYGLSAGLLVFGSLGHVAAQATTQAVAPAPATTPSVTFESRLKGYRAFVDQTVESWSLANERVNRIGGWRIYAREAAKTATESSSGVVAPAAESTPTGTSQPAAAKPTPQPANHGHSR